MLTDRHLGQPVLILRMKYRGGKLRIPIAARDQPEAAARLFYTNALVSILYIRVMKAAHSLHVLRKSPYIVWLWVVARLANQDGSVV